GGRRFGSEFLRKDSGHLPSLPCKYLTCRWAFVLDELSRSRLTIWVMGYRRRFVLVEESQMGSCRPAGLGLCSRMKPCMGCAWLRNDSTTFDNSRR
ncbi:hypothetical protein CH063_11286, partial [Colletotrichum higginsianum]